MFPSNFLAIATFSDGWRPSAPLARLMVYPHHQSVFISFSQMHSIERKTLKIKTLT